MHIIQRIFVYISAFIFVYTCFWWLYLLNIIYRSIIFEDNSVPEWLINDYGSTNYVAHLLLPSYVNASVILDKVAILGLMSFWQTITLARQGNQSQNRSSSRRQQSITKKIQVSCRCNSMTLRADWLPVSRFRAWFYREYPIDSSSSLSS